MKTLFASLAAIVVLSTGASAGGHRHHGHHRGHHSYGHFSHGHHNHAFWAKRVYVPVYVAPAQTCKIVYNYGHARKVCFNTYGH